jgi:hypothetical protein
MGHNGRTQVEHIASASPPKRRHPTVMSGPPLRAISGHPQLGEIGAIEVRRRAGVAPAGPGLPIV